MPDGTMPCKLNVVLVEPEIPPNTGNIGRLCVATQSTLHLVEPLGFSIDDSQVKRAGLDYWEHLQIIQHANMTAFWNSLPPSAPFALFSTKAKRSYLDHQFEEGSYLIFGKETMGLPEPLLAQYEDRAYRIPIHDDRVRSLNLSNAASIIIYEALRQLLP